MSFEMIWQKIVEYAIRFYNYAMTQGESNFMISNVNIFSDTDLPKEMTPFFIGSFVVMILTAIFACDYFDIFHPIQGIKEWKNKISIIKVVVFAAAVFSFHTFYKMLVGILGGLIGADASVKALECLGSYINPISIMIYAFAICTMKMRRRWIQAIMLGLVLFLTPSAMSFYGFTFEHLSIYGAAILIAITGGILYSYAEKEKCSPFLACFVLDLVYLVAKFFMIYYSDSVHLISHTDLLKMMEQYLACMEMDMIFALILLLLLFAYKIATTENVSVKKNLVFPIIIAVITIFSLIFGNTELQYQSDYAKAVMLSENKEYEEALSILENINGYKDSQDYIDLCLEGLYQPTYNQGETFMRYGKYKEALEKFESISDYKDSAEKIDECKKVLLSEMTGKYVSSVKEGNIFWLKEDGKGCYSQGDTDYDGEWTIDDDEWKLYFTIYVSKDDTVVVYSFLNKGYDTTSLHILSDNSRWDEEDGSFDKIEFTYNPQNEINLVGTWQGETGSELILNEDGTCHYAESSAEGDGTWYVDDQAQIRIDLESLDIQLFALLKKGYDTTNVLMHADQSRWNDEVFTKQ